MLEPWDRPDHLSWRIYADFLMESGAPAPDIKRAVKYALGLRQRPRLVLFAEEAALALPRIPQQPRTDEWRSPYRTFPSWATGQHLSRAFCCDTEDYLATPADFPGMLDFNEAGALVYFSIVHDFYRKCSENVAVRCRKGVVSVRYGRRASAPWILWNGE